MTGEQGFPLGKSACASCPRAALFLSLCKKTPTAWLLLHTREAEVECAPSLFEHPKIDRSCAPDLLNLLEHGQRLAFRNYGTYTDTHTIKKMIFSFFLQTLEYITELKNHMM